MDAMVFDFDGVVVDSEPVHLVCFRRVLKAVGVELSEREYYTRYLGFDDRDCIRQAAEDHGVQLAEHRVVQLIDAKTRLVQWMFRESIAALPGAAELIHAAHDAGVPLAICSGALREEIELAATTVGVRDCFSVIVPAEDVERGKPDPQGYRLALARLREASGRKIRAAASVVVEDAPAGIDAAHAAQMRVLAVTTSYPADALSAADRIVASLADVTPTSLEELVAD